MNTFVPGWYVIYTRPRHERKICARLTESKIVSFLPTRKSLKTWHDRRRYIDEPLFPSYIFIFLSDPIEYYNGLGTEGVLYYVRSGKEVARVSESIINTIRLMAEKGSDLEISEQQFLAGQKLVIAKGPFTGLSCEIVSSGNKEKLLVRVDLLRRNLLLTLPQEHLMAI